MAQFTIGIDVGGTKTAYGVFNSERKLIKKYKKPSNSKHTAEQFFNEIADSINELMKICNISHESLRGIGIGMPSYIKYNEGYILKTVNLTNITNFPARDYLKEKLAFNVPILLDNDSHTGALAEYKYGAGRGFDHIIYCPVSTGISSGIIINGKLFRGTYGWAGESGHMMVGHDEGVLCGCGNKGCIMSFSSGSMIVKHIQNWINNGESSVLVNIAGSPDNITAIHLDEAFELGDPLTQRAIEQMAKYLAIWIYNLYVTLNINCFVFGGGLLGMGDKLFKRFREIFDYYNQDDNPVHFLTTELGNDFGIIGASELLFT